MLNINDDRKREKNLLILNSINNKYINQPKLPPIAANNRFFPFILKIIPKPKEAIKDTNI